MHPAASETSTTEPVSPVSGDRNAEPRQARWKSFRPSYLQELIRQWILLIPLTTAVFGAAALRMLPPDEYEEMMPPIFFIGALVVTAAMMHQRNLLSHNLALTDELSGAHERLDTLHHLSLELSTSLHASQVAQSVLQHALKLVEAGAGALWLHTDVLAPEELEALLQDKEIELSEESLSARPAREDVVEPKKWRLFAVTGMGSPSGKTKLRFWKNHLDGQDLAAPVMAPLDPRVAWVPIMWKGTMGGALFVQRTDQQQLQKGGILLDDIALIAGPAMQNALLYQTTAERAEVDGLTRLYNHRAMQERLQQEVARSSRTRATNPDAGFSIVVMDVTDFKLFNDTYGHAIGDQVLRNISNCLRKSFRSSDTVGRFGGDEFLVLLPDTPGGGAETLCSRVVNCLASRPFLATDGSRISVRLTFGVASFPEDGEDATELLRKADERLYGAKRKGAFLVNQAAAKPGQPETLILKPEWESIGLFETLIATIDSKDHYTRGQSERVWRYALMIAHQLKLPQEMMQAVHLCSLVHDVGKIVIPDTILRKPGLLTPDEFRVMEQHTNFGAMMIKDLSHLETVQGGVRHHHEHWDGSGYPDKLSGEQIPMLARILAVADSFAAMVSQRPYRKALSDQQALAEIELQSGKHYDPAVVDAFKVALNELSQDSSALQQVLLVNNIEHLCRLEPVPSASRDSGGGNRRAAR